MRELLGVVWAFLKWLSARFDKYIDDQVEDHNKNGW